MFEMKYDQGVIIKFLLNERTNARNIVNKFQTQFCEHAYQLRTIPFEITEARLDRQDVYNEVHTGTPQLDGLEAKILAILDKFPLKSTHSIAKKLIVANSPVL
jgi:hypothetical protein